MLPPWQPLLGPLACLPVRSVSGCASLCRRGCSLRCMRRVALWQYSMHALPFVWDMMGVWISSRSRSEVTEVLGS